MRYRTFGELPIGVSFGWMDGCTVYKKINRSTAILLSDNLNSIENVPDGDREIRQIPNFNTIQPST